MFSAQFSGNSSYRGNEHLRSKTCVIHRFMWNICLSVLGVPNARDSIPSRRLKGFEVAREWRDS